MSNNNKATVEDTRTVDEPDHNERSVTARSKKVQRRRKSTRPFQKTNSSTIEDNKTGSESTNRSTSSISSTRNDNESGASSSSSLPRQPQRSKVKRFFLKVSEKMGGVETTQYSKEFIDSVEEIDNYKLCLVDLLQKLVELIQRNPKLQARPLEKLEYEYHDNTNPYELLYPALKEYSKFIDGPGLQKQIEMSSKLGALHRGFHRRSRRCLRNVRKFLCEDYDILWDARKVLNDRRQEMDFAKHELKNAKTPEVVQMKNSVYENSQKHFEAQLQTVLTLLDQFPRMKESHLKDIQTFQAIYKVYHEQMSQIFTSK